MDAETRKAIEGAIALTEIEVMRLHLKLRRQHRALATRIEALELAVLGRVASATAPPDELGGRPR